MYNEHAIRNNYDEESFCRKKCAQSKKEQNCFRQPYLMLWKSLTVTMWPRLSKKGGKQKDIYSNQITSVPLYNCDLELLLLPSFFLDIAVIFEKYSRKRGGEAKTLFSIRYL